MATDTAKKNYWGTGRRKSAVARVRITAGTGKILINDRHCVMGAVNLAFG